MTKAANTLAILGLALIAAAGWLVHPSLGLALIGGECLLIAVGIVRINKNNEGQ
jgi:hypothetical protein